MSRKLDTKSHVSANNQSIQTAISYKKHMFKPKALRTAIWQQGHVKFPTIASPGSALAKGITGGVWTKPLICKKKSTRYNQDISHFSKPNHVDSSLLKVKTYEQKQETG